MFKIVWVARFKEGMPRDDARAYWTDVHAKIGLNVSGITGYVQNHMVGTIGSTGVIDTGMVFDGYSCEYFADQSSFEAAMASPEWAQVVEDGYHLFDMSSMEGMSAVLQQRTIRDGPRGSFKVVWFAKFRSDLTREQASDHWLNVAGPLSLPVPGIDRYQQNLVVGSIGYDGVTDDPVAFDGFSEVWFADYAAYERAMASPEWAEVVVDGANFLDMEGLEAGMSGVAEERIIVPEPQT